jgi:hypothetical protein
MMRCVVFLFGLNHDGAIRKMPGGTGFLVGYYSRDLPHLWHIYAVSNQHVVTESPYIRLNTKSGTARFLEYNPDQWSFSETDDLAIIDVTDDLDFDLENLTWTDDIMWVNELDLLKYEEGASRAYVGDDTIMIGLFADRLGGGNINLPVARFGNLAAFADDNVPVSVGIGDRFRRPAFLNDMRSRTGFSGSPVWAWYNPNSDVRSWEVTLSPSTLLTEQCGVQSLFDRSAPRAI